MERDIIETKGAEALKRLFSVANRDSGQCRYVAQLLLGLYNGERFPFDLTNLRAIDNDLFEDCMAVLRMDARVTRQEVHRYFDNGGKRFEKLAKDWAIEDMEKVRADAKRAAQPEGEPAPLHDGGDFDATLLSLEESPGYRNMNAIVKLGQQDNTTVNLRLSRATGETLLTHLISIHALAWKDAERGPLDRRQGEQRPAWLDQAPSQW